MTGDAMIARGQLRGDNPNMKPQAPTIAQMKLALNKQGMYSPLEKAAMAVPRSKGTPAEFMAEVSKQPGFRKEEVEDRKISLPDQKMTKEQFLGHLKNHPAPLIDEKVHEDISPDKYDELTDQFSQEMFGDDYHMLSNREQRQVRERLEAMPQADHEQWTLPGGENYREVLLKKPGFTGQNAIMQIEADLRRTDDPQLQAGLMKRLMELKKQQQQHGDIFPGNPNHFGGEPGIIASLRLKDRTGPNGEKILHVEEIQSDWHQEGRKQGYADPQARERLLEQIESAKQAHQDYLNQMKAKYSGEGLQYVRNMTSEEKEEARRLAGESERIRQSAPVFSNQVPDAPFKKNWHELALKHALGMAAKGGYHGIAITPGEQQAERYNLSKQIDELHYNPQTHRLIASKGGRRLVDENSVPPEKLEAHVGKEAAAKIMAQEPNVNGLHSLTGQDLKVGGEGMKGFYDKIIPAYLNKLGKPHGAQVQMNAVPLTGTINIDDYVHPSETADVARIKSQSMHYFPITDSMRQQIKQEGLPQYEQGGKVKGLDHFFQSDDGLDHFFQE